MPLRDILKKKGKAETEDSHSSFASKEPPNIPQFTFIRSDTHTQEVITPPPYDDAPEPSPSLDGSGEVKHRFSRLSLKPRPRAHSTTSSTSPASDKSRSRERPPPNYKRLSQRLGLNKRDPSSSAVPQDLPQITDSHDEEGTEGQWEQRATILARENEKSRSSPNTPLREKTPEPSLRRSVDGRDVVKVSTQDVDDNIQEAIRLHEAGELERATRMFGRLADPGGENNALSQVLYGLALRHGWGCTADPEKAMTYLSAAASNAASIEDLALRAGQKKGGAAKGELVLAIFELANSFRHGWGVKKDPVAAKQYYETAANLGDSDAMNEVGWCYLEGFGCKKDKLASAKYYRLAETSGNKILGNTWIWKPKYDPPTS